MLCLRISDYYWMHFINSQFTLLNKTQKISVLLWNSETILWPYKQDTASIQHNVWTKSARYNIVEQGWLFNFNQIKTIERTHLTASYFFLPLALTGQSVCGKNMLLILGITAHLINTLRCHELPGSTTRTETM